MSYFIKDEFATSSSNAGGVYNGGVYNGGTYNSGAYAGAQNNGSGYNVYGGACNHVIVPVEDDDDDDYDVDQIIEDAYRAINAFVNHPVAGHSPNHLIESIIAGIVAGIAASQVECNAFEPRSEFNNLIYNVARITTNTAVAAVTKKNKGGIADAPAPAAPKSAINNTNTCTPKSLFVPEYDFGDE